VRRSKELRGGRYSLVPFKQKTLSPSRLALELVAGQAILVTIEADKIKATLSSSSSLNPFILLQQN